MIYVVVNEDFSTREGIAVVAKNHIEAFKSIIKGPGDLNASLIYENGIKLYVVENIETKNCRYVLGPINSDVEFLIDKFHKVHIGSKQ